MRRALYQVLFPNFSNVYNSLYSKIWQPMQNKVDKEKKLREEK